MHAVRVSIMLAAGVTEDTVRNRMKELIKQENVNSFSSQDGLVIAVQK